MDRRGLGIDGVQVSTGEPVARHQQEEHVGGGPALASLHRVEITEVIGGADLPLTQMVAVGSQVADGLAHAHAAGVVHRDVKPGNIMLGQDGRAWLTDFGIARLLGDDAHHTQTGMTIGSPAYLVPEQVRGQEVSPATDVYSFGLVLLEMLTGRRAYPQPATALEPGRRPTAAEVAQEIGVLSGGGDGAAATAVMASEGVTTRVMPPAASSTQTTPTAAAAPIRVSSERSSGLGRRTTRRWSSHSATSTSPCAEAGRARASSSSPVC